MVIDSNDIPKQDYLVLCHTITYNHAPYITDTMNGLCMQQTDFPYACYIIDDASTDGEQDVIKAYLDEHFQMNIAERFELELANVIVAKHNTNPNCTFAIYLLKRNLWKEPDLKRPLGRPWAQRCKYIACCEGDDYWTDPLKLQKQVDFMEAHPDAAICFHRVNTFLQNEQRVINLYPDESFCLQNITICDFIKANNAATCSCLYRSEYRQYIPTHIPVVYGDWLTYLAILQASGLNAYILPEVMGTYRVNDGGVYGSSFGTADGIAKRLRGNVDFRNTLQNYNFFNSKLQKEVIEAYHSSYDDLIRLRISNMQLRVACQELLEYIHCIPGFWRNKLILFVKIVKKGIKILFIHKK